MTAVRVGHREVLDRLAVEVRRRKYSIRTEQAYAGVVGFLEELAVRCNVAASTQNQALNVLVFLYNQVLDRPLGELQGVVRAKRPRRLPVVLTKAEVTAVLAHTSGGIGACGPGMMISGAAFGWKRCLIRLGLAGPGSHQPLERGVHTTQ